MNIKGFIKLIDESSSDPDARARGYREKLKKAIISWPGYDELTLKEKFQVFKRLNEKFGPQGAMTMPRILGTYVSNHHYIMKDEAIQALRKMVEEATQEVANSFDEQGIELSNEEMDCIHSKYLKDIISELKRKDV